MLSKLDCKRPNQNFGMALKLDKSALEFLRNKNLRTKDFELLEDLYKSNQKVKFHVNVGTQDSGKRLNVIITDSEKYPSDKYFATQSFIGNPVKWIKKQCKVATDLEDKYYHNPLDDLFDRYNIKA